MNDEEEEGGERRILSDEEREGANQIAKEFIAVLVFGMLAVILFTIWLVSCLKGNPQWDYLKWAGIMAGIISLLILRF